MNRANRCIRFAQFGSALFLISHLFGSQNVFANESCADALLAANRRSPILIGGGLTSALLATYLGLRGSPVEIFEKRPDPRLSEINEQRAIGMALTTRGMHALEQVGLDRVVHNHAIPLTGRMIHQEGGGLLFQPYGDKPEHVHYSIERTTLAKELLSTAEKAGATIHFQFECDTYDPDTGKLIFRTPQGEVLKTCPTLIGTDGSSSTIRRTLAKRKDFRNSETPSEYAYKEITIPAGDKGEFQMDPHAMHVWPRGSFVMIALPTRDGNFRAGLYLQKEGPVSFSNLNSLEAARLFLQTHFEDVLQIAPSAPEELHLKPLGRLGTVNVYPWHLDSRVLLLGDAAHAMLPFFGQGANCGFEDCEILMELYDKDPNAPWPSLFAQFQNRRYQDATAIGELALENQREMSSTVRDPSYHFKRKVEAELKRRFPDRFIPRYEMIVFSRLSYQFAKERGAINAKIIDDLIFNKNSLDDIDWERARTLVESELHPLKQPH